MPSHFPRNSSKISAAFKPAKAGLVLAMSVFVLSGCAAQFAYQDALKLVANDNVEAGLAKFQEALKLDPNNAEYRASYSRTREQTIRALLEQADRLVEAGRRGDAEKVYRRALSIDTRNDRALAALVLVSRDERHAGWLNDAAGEVEQKHVDAARAKLLMVLGENPRNEKARSMLRGLEAKVEAPALETLLAAAYKQPISIDFKDGTLKQVFDVVAHSSGLNILFDKDVKLDQKTSIILKHSTIEAVIYYMLLTNQLEQQVMDANTLLIYPSNPGKQKDYQQLVVRTFLLANASAKAVGETLKTIIKMRDVVVDEKLNMLIVRDSPEAIKLAEKLVAMQDVAEPEVMLEVEVLEVARTRLMELGVSLPGSLTLTPLVSTLADLRGLNQQSIGATIEAVKINARKLDTDANILANPRIRVLNREKAKIIIGNRVPSITTSVVPTSGSSIVTEAVTYLDVGLKLEVEPTVYLDNDVAIRIGLEVSNIVDTQTSANGTVTYTIGTRTANTMLRLKDGENQVLAGLISDEDRHTANKFPGLGEMPVVGRLFGSALNNGLKSEIVLSITPHLIRNLKRPEAASAEFLSGTENSLRRRPDFSARPNTAPVTPVATDNSKPAALPLPSAPALVEPQALPLPSPKVEPAA